MGEHEQRFEMIPKRFQKVFVFQKEGCRWLGARHQLVARKFTVQNAVQNRLIRHLDQLIALPFVQVNLEQLAS